jgi:hypothetical protein
VHITWNPASGATYYDIYRNTSNSHVSELLLVSGLPFSPHDDFSVVQDVPYYYWVKACNTTGCSDYSSSNSGYAASEVIVNMIYLPLVMGQEDIPPQTIINGDFEQAHVGWTEYSSHGWDIITPDSSAPVSAHSGNWLAWLGGDYSDTSYVSQSIVIPPGTPFLHYWYWIGSEDICGYDYFRIKLGTTTMHTKDLCGSQNTVGWVEGVVNLSAFAGTTQNLKFEVTTDSSGNSNLFLEDVSISGIASAYEGVVIPDYVNLDSVKSER